MRESGYENDVCITTSTFSRPHWCKHMPPFYCSFMPILSVKTSIKHLYLFSICLLRNVSSCVLLDRDWRRTANNLKHVISDCLHEFAILQTYFNSTTIELRRRFFKCFFKFRSVCECLQQSQFQLFANKGNDFTLLHNDMAADGLATQGPRHINQIGYGPRTVRVNR